jgi:hypothetical protein
MGHSAGLSFDAQTNVTAWNGCDIAAICSSSTFVRTHSRAEPKSEGFAPLSTVPHLELMAPLLESMAPLLEGATSGALGSAITKDAGCANGANLTK